MKLVAGLLLATAVTAAAEGDGWKRFASPAGKFSLELPQAWRLLKNIPGVLLAAAGPQEGPDDKFIENLTVDAVPNSPPRTIEDFWEIYLRSIPAAIDGFKLVGKGEIQVDGRPGRKLIYEQNLEGSPVEVLQVVFMRDDKVFILTYTDGVTTFDRRLADFERSATSIRFD